MDRTKLERVPGAIIGNISGWSRHRKVHPRGYPTFAPRVVLPREGGLLHDPRGGRGVPLVVSHQYHPGHPTGHWFNHVEKAVPVCLVPIRVAEVPDMEHEVDGPRAVAVLVLDLPHRAEGGDLFLAPVSFQPRVRAILHSGPQVAKEGKPNAVWPPLVLHLTSHAVPGVKLRHVHFSQSSCRAGLVQSPPHRVQRWRRGVEDAEIAPGVEV
mmetsp:Transcript_12114/g.17869  ORF Transcript_12114/g.17869 Transcript_12114/m.17869 type:complete len:211 (-) Transcript_12114:812-1444(-)